MRVAIDKFRSLSSAFFYFRGSSISALVSTQLEGRCACEGRQTNLYGSSAGNDWREATSRDLAAGRRNRPHLTHR